MAHVTIYGSAAIKESAVNIIHKKENHECCRLQAIIMPRGTKQVTKYTLHSTHDFKLKIGVTNSEWQLNYTMHMQASDRTRVIVRELSMQLPFGLYSTTLSYHATIGNGGSKHTLYSHCPVTGVSRQIRLCKEIPRPLAVKSWEGGYKLREIIQVQVGDNRNSRMQLVIS